MKRFIEGVGRGQSTLFPECLEGWVGEENPVRVIDVFVDELDLGGLGVDRAEPEAIRRHCLTIANRELSVILNGSFRIDAPRTGKGTKRFSSFAGGPSGRFFHCGRSL